MSKITPATVKSLTKALGVQAEPALWARVAVATRSTTGQR